MPSRCWLVTGALLGALGVVLGAFGAHALQSAVESWEETPEQRQHLLNVWDTAVRYQMYHALALIAVGLLAASRGSRLLTASGLSFLLGVLIFSGLLYARVLTGLTVLGAIVPIGGLALIVGWILLAVAGWRHVSDGQLPP